MTVSDNPCRNVCQDVLADAGRRTLRLVLVEQT
jgi:hypothetical protein